LYLTGGLTPKNLDLICRGGSDSLFMQAFRDKGRVSGMIADVPIFALKVSDNLGSRGAKLQAYKDYLKNQ